MLVCSQAAVVNVCSQAAVVNATGLSLEALGIEQVPYPRNQYDPGARINFLEVQSMLPDFELRKHGVDFDEMIQVFRKTSGVYLIHEGPPTNHPSIDRRQ